MPMPTLQQIIGTITGKVAFERTQANFTTIKDTHNALETVVGTKAPNADLVAHKADITSPHSIYAKKAQGNWILATLQDGWTQHANNFKYAKNELGIVTLRISGVGGAIPPGTIIAQLPVGYRPLAYIPVPVLRLSSGNYEGHFVKITTEGNIHIEIGTVYINGDVYVGEVSFNVN